MKQRVTKQKELIEENIAKMKGFFNAEELYEKVSKTDSSLGIATVYRNLKDKVKRCELYNYTCDRRQVYSTTKQHCHYIDANGNVTHFEIENLDFLKGKIPGKIESIQIEVRGE